mmetsp:Transcript_31902/g.104499  ORF Transcript_31902/g.104499 Transcript_31902/m.104499 type:complete len:456 (+) Transcript_31902:191-1558(+)
MGPLDLPLLWRAVRPRPQRRARVRRGPLGRRRGGQPALPRRESARGADGARGVPRRRVHPLDAVRCQARHGVASAQVAADPGGGGGGGGGGRGVRGWGADDDVLLQLQRPEGGAPLLRREQRALRVEVLRGGQVPQAVRGANLVHDRDHGECNLPRLQLPAPDLLLLGDVPRGAPHHPPHGARLALVPLPRRQDGAQAGHLKRRLHGRNRGARGAGRPATRGRRRKHDARCHRGAAARADAAAAAAVGRHAAPLWLRVWLRHHRPRRGGGVEPVLWERDRRKAHCRSCPLLHALVAHLALPRRRALVGRRRQQRQVPRHLWHRRARPRADALPRGPKHDPPDRVVPPPPGRRRLPPRGGDGGHGRPARQHRPRHRRDVNDVPRLAAHARLRPALWRLRPRLLRQRARDGRVLRRRRCARPALLLVRRDAARGRRWRGRRRGDARGRRWRGGRRGD